MDVAGKGRKNAPEGPDSLLCPVSLAELGVRVTPCSALTEALFSAWRLMTGVWVLQELMTIFQLLHWNGSLKALRETKCSRQVRFYRPGWPRAVQTGQMVMMPPGGFLYLDSC